MNTWCKSKFGNVSRNWHLVVRKASQVVPLLGKTADAASLASDPNRVEAIHGGLAAFSKAIAEMGENERVQTREVSSENPYQPLAWMIFVMPRKRFWRESTLSTIKQ